MLVMHLVAVAEAAVVIMDFLVGVAVVAEEVAVVVGVVVVVVVVAAVGAKEAPF